MSNVKKKEFNYYFELDPDLLPDFVTQKVSKAEAAKQLYAALKEQARRTGHIPECEVMMSDDHSNFKEIDEGDIWVAYEAGPHDWGVGYSLGSCPDSYSFPESIQDWYLETYYGFDVIFCDR